VDAFQDCAERDDETSEITKMALNEKDWHRGDWIIRGTENGFVKSDMRDGDEYLAVHWQSGEEKIQRSKLQEIRKATKEELVEAENLGALPSLKALEAIEGMENLETLTAERRRTIRGQREQRIVDDLIRRGFAYPCECGWDKKHADMIVVLALQPDQVGWLFKIRERLHRPIHALFHRQR
jgi:hypothetical protein